MNNTLVVQGELYGTFDDIAERLDQQIATVVPSQSQLPSLPGCSESPHR
jgi:hypothetical protein